MRKSTVYLTVLAFIASTVLIAPVSPAVADVPPATGNNAVIAVKTGGDRVGVAGVAPLAGVTLGLFTSQGATTPVAEFGTCVSDGDGDCSFTVPDTQRGGTNRDRRFWVKQIDAPTGFYTNPTLAVGSPVAAAPYAFQTDDLLRAGQTYTSTADFMIGTGNSNNSASGGVWQSSRTNPVLPAQCGLSVAIVADLSNSVTSSDLVQLKGAATTFVNALTGTPSTTSLFTFATDAPAAGAANVNRPALMPVSTPAGAATVNGYINAWSLPGGNAGGTNWDQAFEVVADAPQVYDVVVVITDGNPTFFGTEPVQGPGSRTRFREMENGIFSANAVKEQGSRVIAMGVGSGVSGTPANLRAISGVTPDSDYYQVTDYSVAGDALRALALGNCTGSLTVVKQVLPPGTPAGSIDGAQPAGGWTFDAATATPGVTINPAVGETADGTGAVNFDLAFAGGTTTAPVTATETPQTGYTLRPTDGANAVCARVDTGASLPVTNVGADGFTVTTDVSYPVSCTVYNLAEEPPASIVVSKFWDVDGTLFPDGSQPSAVSADLTLDGEDWLWTDVQTGRNAGDVVAIDETTTIAPGSLCELTGSRLSAVGDATVDLPLPYDATLDAGANSYEVTNTVTCPAQLTLLKGVINGPASASDWELTATGPDGALDGPTGETGITANVTPLVPYALSEDDADPRYVQQTLPNVEPAPGSTGSWICLRVDPTTDGVLLGFLDGLDGDITVPRGVAVTCLARNLTASLTLVKEVENTDGGTAVPAEWELTADPGDNPFGLTSETVTGSAEGVEVFVRPGQAYELSESDGPDGYELSSLECIVNDDPAVPDNAGSIVLERGQSAVCTFVNVDQPATLTLVKTVDNDFGGTSAPTDWTLSADGPTSISGVTGAASVTAAEVDAGTYALSESGGPDGYDASDWSCDAGTLDGANLTLTPGQSATCTITNSDRPAELTLVKTVTNDNGGTATPDEWTLSATGPTTIEGTTGSAAVTAAEVNAGTYELAEAGGPDGYTAGAWSCDAGTLTGSSLVLPIDVSATCTIDNDDQPAVLTLVKIVDPAASGSGRVPADWTLTATGTTTVSGNGDSTSAGGVNAVTVDAGSYALSESGPDGFDPGDWSCTGGTLTESSVTVPSGGDVTCTITNTAVAPTLTLVKVVDNGETGATTPPTAWTMNALNGDSTITGVTGSSAVTSAAAIVGTYTLSEDGPAGYTASEWVCTGAEGASATSVTLAEGDDATCTITNTAIAPSLTLVKIVDNGDTGGTAVDTDWTLTAANADFVLSGVVGDPSVTDAVAIVGTYALGEDGPTGYEASAWTCEGASSSAAGSVSLSPGDDATCTVVNTAIAPELTLIKVVDNADTGATTPPSAWTLTADGAVTITGATGTPAVTSAAVTAGTYALSEEGPDGYTASDWVCEGAEASSGSSVELVVGDAATCTITNTPIAPELTLVKAVENAYGGTAAPTDWTLTAAGASTISGPTGDASVTDVVVQVGVYALSESDGPAGYSASDWVCEGAALATASSVTLAPGETAVCTITNSDVPTFLTLVKIVENTHGGTQPPTAWTLTAAGPTPISGATGSAAVTTVLVSAGTYTLSESGPSGYDASAWSCAGAETAGDTVTLALGTAAICTIVNTERAPVPPLPPTGGEVSGWLPAIGLVLAGLAFLAFHRRRAA